MTNKRVAVIGGGISGLTAAFKLKKAGIDVVLFEGGPGVGGNIETERRDGFLIEKGPNSTLASVGLMDLLDELAIAGEIAQPSPAANKRYILKDGELAALPSSVVGLLTGGVFSAKAKLRLLQEPFITTKSHSGESVADFFERRLGKEIVDRAADPFISGIYAGDPARLSIRVAFPRLFEMERDHGSLLAASLFGRKDKTKRPVPKGTPRSITFKRGMQTLPDALRAELKNEVRLNTKVENITRDGSGAYTLTANGQQRPFAAVILSTPAHSAAGLVKDLDGALAEQLLSVYYPPVSVVFTGFRRQQVTEVASGFGFLVPGSEHRRILGSLWTSSVFEGRAPEGYHLFTTFIGGSRQAKLCDGSDDELVKTAVDELGSIMGVEGDPEFVEVKSWKKAIPQYNIGYESVLAAIEGFSRSNAGMYVCSNYYKGISVSDCIKNAGATAVETIEFLKA